MKKACYEWDVKDRRHMCKPAPEVRIEEHDFCMICPECGHHPLTLMGKRKGLTLKLTGGKAQCPVCPYEMEL